MKFFFKAAPVAVFSLTLLSGTVFSDAGFASGVETQTALAADTIQVDADLLAADEATRKAALTGNVPANLTKNEAIVFTPGTGAPMAVPSIDQDQADEPDTKPLTAKSLAALVKAHGTPGELDAEGRCLAGAVYFESKGESLEGQLAVARVVMARAKSGRFPSTICGVVYQRSQFSFVRGGRMPAIQTGSQHWRNAVAISRIALDDSWKSPVEGALFFHARHVSPGWRLQRIGSVDNHIFYR
ncbi:MAG: cell wall hydrolase [Sphingorhabdus sp.]